MEQFPRQPAGIGSDWWQHDASADCLLATLDEHDVDRAVVVQAVGVYGFDCRCAVAAAASAPDRLALVGAIDMSVADPAASLDTMCALGPVRGVRLFGVGPDEPRWLGDGRAAAVWDRASELGLTIVPTVFAPQLTNVFELAARQPDVPVALDHCGFVDAGDARAMGLLLALAGTPSVSLKVSSYVLAAAAANGDPAEFVDVLAEAFGTDRLCWGSDHPQHQEHTYPQKLDLARRAVRNFDDAGQARFFGATALRLWWP